MRAFDRFQAYVAFIRINNLTHICMLYAFGAFATVVAALPPPTRTAYICETCVLQIWSKTALKYTRTQCFGFNALFFVS